MSEIWLMLILLILPGGVRHTSERTSIRRKRMGFMDIRCALRTNVCLSRAGRKFSEAPAALSILSVRSVLSYPAGIARAASGMRNTGFVVRRTANGKA